MDKPDIGSACNGCGLCCRLRVCSTGSFALGLVHTFGDRVDGPCPALEQDGDKWVCGLITRPKHYLPGSPRGVTALREAAKILTGAGVGCDEAGDEPDATAQPKLRAVEQQFLRRHRQTDIQKAVKIFHGIG